MGMVLCSLQRVAGYWKLLCFFLPVCLCCWIRGWCWYQRCWEGCTRQAFVCFGKAGLQLADVMCKSHWVRQHSVQEESWLIDWDAHYHRHPLRSSTPPPRRPPVCSCSGSTCACLHFLNPDLPYYTQAFKQTCISVHVRKQRCMVSHTVERKKKHSWVSRCCMNE